MDAGPASLDENEAHDGVKCGEQCGVSALWTPAYLHLKQGPSSECFFGGRGYQ
jgi:hypothetical protein